jgi:hypothetical protein
MTPNSPKEETARLSIARLQSQHLWSWGTESCVWGQTGISQQNPISKQRQTDRLTSGRLLA